MRLLTVAVISSCVVSPVFANSITLTPTASATFHGALPHDYNAEINNCETSQAGEVAVLPAGSDGSIGAMTGLFSADDRRTNWEFDISGLSGKVKRASLRFDARAQYGDDGQENCLFGYIGNGTIEHADYLPSATQVSSFYLEWDEGDWGLDANLDITSFVAGFQVAGIQFLGLQAVKSTYDDTIIDLWDVRLVIVTVPEPAAVALFGLGLASLGLRRRRAQPSGRTGSGGGFVEAVHVARA